MILINMDFLLRIDENEKLRFRHVSKNAFTESTVTSHYSNAVEQKRQNLFVFLT